MKSRTLTIFLSLFLFTALSFAQSEKKQVTEPTIALSDGSHSFLSCIALAPSGVCFSLTSMEETRQDFLFCGTGMSNRDLRRQSSVTPELRIIDFQGNTLMTIEPELTPCFGCEEPMVHNDSGSDDGNDGSVIIACGFGTLNAVTEMCGEVCLSSNTLQPGHYVAIFTTKSGTATKKFAVVGN